MAKDPAFLFYSKDWLSDFQGLTMEERGQYLTLICIQHQNGPLTEKMIRLSCGNAAADVLALFRQDENGLFYSERLKNEIEKRAAHAEKQRTRAVDGWKKRKQSIEEQDVDDKSTISHGNAAALPLVNVIVNGNVNEDVNVKKEISKKSTFEIWMEIFPFKSAEAKKAVSDYIEHRRQLKVKKYTDIGWQQACKEWESWGEAVFIEAVYIAISKNWQGIFHPLKSNTNGNNTQKSTGRVEPAPHGTEFGSFKRP